MTGLAEARLAPRPDIAIREIDDGAVLVDLRSGGCFELNRIGFEVWQLLQKGTTATHICTEMLQRYAVDPNILETDVSGLVDSLVNAGLLEPVGGL